MPAPDKMLARFSGLLCFAFVAVLIVTMPTDVLEMTVQSALVFGWSYAGTRCLLYRTRL